MSENTKRKVYRAPSLAKHDLMLLAEMPATGPLRWDCSANTPALIENITACWCGFISGFETVFGALAYLASLRSRDSGQYRHYGLALILGEPEASEVAGRSHNEVFLRWLALGADEQKSDLERYLSGLPGHRRQIIEDFRKSAAYQNFIPCEVRSSERELYIAELETLISAVQPGEQRRSSLVQDIDAAEPA